MRHQKTTITLLQTTRLNALLRRALVEIKPMNSFAACGANPSSQRFGYGWESDSRCAGRVTM